MDNLYIEAYKFYKNDYAHGLVLFHIQSHFEAYEDDAIQLGAVLNLPVHPVSYTHLDVYKRQERNIGTTN